MKRSRHVIPLALAAGLSALAMKISAQSGVSTDWPQWRGPDRTGLSKETGLLKQWPPSGPPQVWVISNLGIGYGSMAIRDDRIFVQGSSGRQSMVYALNRADGRTIWSKSLGAAGENDRGSGPRGTPTLDADRIYVQTENGDLACLRVA